MQTHVHMHVMQCYICMLGLSWRLDGLRLLGEGMNRAMPSKIDSTSTLADAEETLKDASWRNVSKMDKASIRAEIARLQESGVCFRVQATGALDVDYVYCKWSYLFTLMFTCIYVYIYSIHVYICVYTYMHAYA